MLRQSWRVNVIVVVLVSMLGAVVEASEKVIITFPRKVPGHTQRGNVLLVVHYEENEANQKLVVGWDSESFGGSSEVGITGENNGIPVTRDLSLPAGQYLFTATLVLNDGSVAEVVSRNRIITR